MASTPIGPIFKHFSINVEHSIEQSPKKGLPFLGSKLHIVKPSSLLLDFGGIYEDGCEQIIKRHKTLIHMGVD